MSPQEFQHDELKGGLSSVIKLLLSTVVIVLATLGVLLIADVIDTDDLTRLALKAIGIAAVVGGASLLISLVMRNRT